MADAVEALPPPESGAESGRSSPSPTASPEFEFWMVGRNPSAFPAPALLTADELFSGGVVLPLHNFQAAAPDGDAAPEGAAEGADSAALPLPEAEGEVAAQPLAESGIAPTPDLPAVTFKWKDIFKAGGGEAKDRKKVERRVSSVSGNAELININIWPFSRSRSAGHSAGGGAATGSLSRAKPANPNPNASAGSSGSANTNAGANASAASAPPAPRKVSSAPCSRSNSRGESSGPAPAIPAAAAVAVAAAAAAAAAAAPPAAEEDATAAQAVPLPTPITTSSSSASSMLRRLVPGQGRNNNSNTSGGTGIRVGRPSPVWQLRRNKLQQTAAEQKHASAKKKATPAPTPTAATEAAGDDKAAPSVAAPAAGCRNNAGCSEGAAEEGNPPQGLFGLRTFFSKKVY